MSNARNEGRFEIEAGFEPTGDQPAAIRTLSGGLNESLKHQTLLGVTGSGKTFTMAKIIEEVQRPTLVIAHNKTLAAQLSAEFQDFFPNNSVQYFVSYYDYYQPEAYIPQSDTYIEKESDVNEEIDRLRHAATRALLTRRDTLIVASVSCIYGLGSPEEYRSVVLSLRKGEEPGLRKVVRKLIDMYYERNDMEMVRGRFRLRGDTLEIMPAYEELAVRVQFFGDEIERIIELDPLTGEVLAELDHIDIFPGKHFVTPEEELKEALKDIEDELGERLDSLRSSGKLLEAQRLEQRTNFDLEMLKETGSCPGIENYSRPLGRRPAGSAPWTLLDYFPDDFLIFIDESHITLPQINGMYKGDFARKTSLVDYGFRLPSAIDNRPLAFEEFEDRVNQIVYVSATPGPYEEEHEERRVEQVIRPTGLIDPEIILEPTEGQIDNLLERIQSTIAKHERVLVTTLTKRMAEELSDYLRELGIRVQYLHSDIQTLERTEILRDLRLGVYDVVVGINLLREGLDLPEVSLVAILDADKEGYLRSSTSLVQTIGRAARHVEGKVVMYADRITKSMKYAMDETARRREIQQAHNDANSITPTSIFKEVRDITTQVRQVAETKTPYVTPAALPKNDLVRLVKDLEKQMKKAARDLEFEKAALLRDQVVDLRKVLVYQGDSDSIDPEPGKTADLAPTAEDGVPEELVGAD
ncbi:excinuclease ABC subunit UvrB [Candidatus Lucifugimonas marina]|uniref:UvrABC system protein B n=1 Tax=Candidatus Lucifugimonas marina TaxID=3038979 RepID=A0AAJ5ZIX7_9CHLR|nr:excinuclease ABC subunit UvrB [SAR202 cluster bacterium JH702]MDG0869000.1 excinuclease ABC subunit UvrB [SAR202 cluster bacterium JH639]WFG35624.1 excinuclease ABC subunit UvrB [SAR202 cluster bacterium JH545]WFG39571.1 excinuclease ABC subunit UvrB [SAR202 cluster bacterium JH1073]